MPTITAALSTAPGSDFTLVTAQLDEPRRDEVLVRIVATGFCHTDISVRDQHIPFPLPGVLGHEGSGVVESVGEGVTHVAVGDHVVLAGATCGECTGCLSGGGCAVGFALSFSGRRPDGSTMIRVDGADVGASFFSQSSFATFALVPKRAAVKIPRDVPVELMGPLGCGLRTGAGIVINHLDIAFGSSIAVYGAGPVGLSAIMAAKARGAARIIAVDLHAHRRQLALDLGATTAVDGAAPDVADQVRDASEGPGADYVIDATGVAAVSTAAVASLAPTGRCVLAGVYPPDAVLTWPAGALFAGQTVGGSLGGGANPHQIIPTLVEMWRQGRFPFDRLVSFFDFDQINEAVERSLSGEVLKPILRMSDA